MGEIFSDELLKVYEDKLSKNIEPKEEYPDILGELPKSQLKLYGYYSILNSVFFDNEEDLINWIEGHDLFLGSLVTVDYLDEVAGRTDVILLTYGEDKKELCVPADEHGYGVYNSYRSNRCKQYIWEYNYGDLRGIYDALKLNGIILRRDLYKEIDDKYEALNKIINQEFLTLSRTKKDN